LTNNHLLIGRKQLIFSDYDLITVNKQTKRENTFWKMEAVVPWQELIMLIEPREYKVSKKYGRPPYPLTTMPQIHLLQQWYSLHDPATEEALTKLATMRCFAGIELMGD